MTAERFLSPYYYHDLLQVAQNEVQIQLLLEIRELVANNTANGLMKVETHERREILDIDKELVQLNSELSYFLFINRYIPMRSPTFNLEKAYQIKEKLEKSKVEVKAFRVFHLAILNISKPLNDFVLFLTKVFMTTVYILLGWLGKITKCIR